MEEVRIDLRIPDEERDKEMKRASELCFKINQTNPTPPECRKLIEELFNENILKNTEHSLWHGGLLQKAETICFKTKLLLKSVKNTASLPRKQH